MGLGLGCGKFGYFRGRSLATKVNLTDFWFWERAPRGWTNSSFAAPRLVPSPRFTHGLRRGLHAYAASRLKLQHCFVGDSKGTLTRNEVFSE
jgi:hypothetical protein